MRAVVLGGGQVGQGIIRYLLSQNYDITLVDHSQEVLKMLSDRYDIKPVQGHASYPDVLALAETREANVLIAVTGSDEVNIVACRVAGLLFGASSRIARLRHQVYVQGDKVSHLDEDSSLFDMEVVISPEIEVARAISRSLSVFGSCDTVPIKVPRLKIVSVRCHEEAPLLGIALKFLSTTLPEMAVLTIERKGMLILPSGEDILMPHDEIYILVSVDHMDRAMQGLGYRWNRERRFLIVGGGKIGINLAQSLKQKNLNAHITVIEKAFERGLEIASSLKHVEVLKGDGLDQDILNQIDLDRIETAVAITQDDKTNILASLMYKKLGAGRVLALLNQSHYENLVTSLGVDGVISPQNVTVSRIRQYLRQNQVLSAHTLQDGAAEIIEARVHETSYLIGLTLEDIEIPSLLKVMFLIRDEHREFFPKNQIISVGDRLIVVAKREASKAVNRLFSRRPSYL